MNELINKPKHSIQYLSPAIQNEIITALSEHLDNQITEEIKSALFYSIIADTTQDISKKDQLRLTIRCAKVTNDIIGQAAEISMAKQQRYQCPSSRDINNRKFPWLFLTHDVW